jgi:ADP-ribose pyrophosphatase
MDKLDETDLSAAVERRTTIHRGRVFRLDREELALANGTTVGLDVIRHPGAAAIVPFSDPGTVVMIRQYRHAVGGVIWEIPAGTLDGDEAPLACARRELIEETGLAAARWSPLGAITPVPAYSDECIHLFTAAELTPARQHLDSDELLHVHQVPLKQALAMIGDGTIQDAKTICALFMAAGQNPATVSFG